MVYLDELSKVFAFNVVVRLQENIPKHTLSKWIVLLIELVKPVKRVLVLCLINLSKLSQKQLPENITRALYNNEARLLSARQLFL